MMCIRTCRFTQMHVGCENPRLEPPKVHSRSGQNQLLRDPKSVLEGGKSSVKHFVGSNSPQDESKTFQERAKSAPKAPQECSRSAKSAATAFQCAPQSTQVGPKSPPKGPWRALGDHFEASNLDRGAFRKRSVARRAQEWFLKDFFDNVSLVRASDEPHFDS